MADRKARTHEASSARPEAGQASLITRVIPNATVFVSSLCIMVIELVAARIIARHLGSSLYTWTSVIGVVLGGIAIGNYIGGRLADRFNAQRTLATMFILASATSALISVFNNVVGELTFLWALPWPMRVASHVALVFFLPSCVLGMISPVVAKMALDLGYKTGRTIGNIYAWGVAGSIIGTFLTGFFLVDRFGTNTIVWSVAGVLAAMAILYRAGSWKTWTWAGLLTFAATLACGSWSWAQSSGEKIHLRQPMSPNVLHSDESQYSYIEVLQTTKNPDVRGLHLDTLLHSRIEMNSPQKLQYDYERMYAAITRRLSRDKRHVHSLMIGGGGYVYPRYMDALWPGSRTDVVEIDPAVTKAAFVAFGLPADTPIKYFHEDGRVFVDRLAKRVNAGKPAELYDFIYLDAFNDYSVPYQLTTQEFMRNVAMLLTPEGGFLINVIDIFESGKMLGSLVNTVQTVFPYVHVFVEGAPNSLTRAARNTFVVAGFKRAPDVDNLGTEEGHNPEIFALTEEEMNELRAESRQLVLTDDYAPVENMLAPVVRDAALEKAADKWDARAKRAITAKRLDEAVYVCGEGLRLSPDHKSLLNTMGRAQFLLGRVHDAVETLTRAIQLRPNHFSAHRGLVDCYLELDENVSALPHFRAILENDPGDETTRYHFGRVLASLGRYAEAIEQFSSLTGFSPNFSKAYNSWAYELFQKGDLEGAIEKYKQAAESDPDFAEPRLNLAKLLLSIERYGQAVDAYRGYLELRTDDPRDFVAAHVDLGRAYAAQDLLAEAQGCYQEALRLAPENVEIKTLLSAVIKARREGSPAVPP